MKFIHTADWQLGMKVAHVGDAAARVREERLAAARRVVKTAQDQGAEFILIAGDTFEHNGVERELQRLTRPSGHSDLESLEALLEKSRAPDKKIGDAENQIETWLSGRKLDEVQRQRSELTCHPELYHGLDGAKFVDLQALRSRRLSTARFAWSRGWHVRLLNREESVVHRFSPGPSRC